jgi:hypothetical protein
MCGIWTSVDDLPEYPGRQKANTKLISDKFSHGYVSGWIYYRQEAIAAAAVPAFRRQITLKMPSGFTWTDPVISKGASPIMTKYYLRTSVGLPSQLLERGGCNGF